MDRFIWQSYDNYIVSTGQVSKCPMMDIGYAWLQNSVHSTADFGFSLDDYSSTVFGAVKPYSLANNYKVLEEHTSSS
jgi:hypothetical protein